MAVRCIQGHYAHLDAKSDTKRILYNMAVRNLRYIYRKQHEDGGFGTVYSTTLAIHADLSRLGIPKSLQPFRFAEARKWLINTQQKVLHISERLELYKKPCIHRMEASALQSLLPASLLEV